MGGCTSKPRGHDNRNTGPPVPEPVGGGNGGNNSTPNNNNQQHNNININNGHVNSGSNVNVGGGQQQGRGDIPLPQPDSQLPLYIALYQYEARTPEDLSFQVNDELRIIEERQDGWWLAIKVSSGEQGFIPCNHITPKNSLGTYQWYHGDIKRQVAEERLVNEKPGTFLVRESESQGVGSFSLSVKDEVGVKHYRIRVTDNKDGYFIRQTHVCRDLPSLIDSHFKQTHGLCTKLIYPCIAQLEDDPDMELGPNMKSCRFSRSCVTKGTLLGSGEFGEVFDGEFRQTPECAPVKVAIKELKGDADTSNPEEFFREAEAMNTLRHGKLVKLYGFVIESKPYWMINEFMSRGDLLGLLRSDGDSFDVKKLVKMMNDVAEGMEFLEQMDYIHRDLAARNVLVNENYICKVADFGLARCVKFDDTTQAEEEDDGIYQPSGNNKFPVKWTAPEAAFWNKYSIKSDVWSFGILMVETVTNGQTPYPGMKNAQVLEKILTGYRIPQPEKATPALYQIMRSCWKVQAEDRPTFESLVVQLSELMYGEDSRYTPAGEAI